MATVQLTASVSQQVLVQKGVNTMLGQVLADLESSEIAIQAQALTALDTVAKRSSADGRGSIAAVQRSFREGGGFPRLVKLLDAARPSQEGQQLLQQPQAVQHTGAQAVRALLVTTRNCAESRQAAIIAGAVPALCNALGDGESPPLSLDVITVLHNLVAPDASGHSTTELFASGGVHTLVRLLSWTMAMIEEPDKSSWSREIIALLYPLAKRSHVISRHLSAHLSTLAHLLAHTEDPLTLSVGLDILEEMLAGNDHKHAAKQMVREGVIAPLVQTLHVRGLGSKAALILTALATDPAILMALRALFQPPDLKALTQIAVRCASADDLDGAAPRQLLAALLRNEGSSMLRGLALARSLGPCLTFPSLRPALLEAAASCEGNAVVHNIHRQCTAEASLAAACLLPFIGDYANLLLRPGMLQALVEAVLLESLEPDPEAAEATYALAGLVATLPDPSGNSPTSRETHPHITLLDNGSSTKATRQMPSGIVRDRMSSLARSSSSLGPGISPRRTSSSVGFGFASSNLGRSDSTAVGLASMGPETHSSRSFATVTFSVAGRELFALAWVVEAASPAIARTLAGIEDLDSVAISVPDVPTVPTNALYGLFAQALEFAYTGELKVDADGVLLLWPLAAALQMEELRAQCEALVPALLEEGRHLEQALLLADMHATTGRELGHLCAGHVCENLQDLHDSGRLGLLAAKHRSLLMHAVSGVLHPRLSAILSNRALHRTSSSALHRTASTVARSSSTPRSPRTLADDLGNKLSFDAWQDAMMRPRRSTSQLSGRSGNGGSPLGKRLTHTQSVPTNWDASAAGSEDVELGSDVEHYRFSGEPGYQEQSLYPDFQSMRQSTEIQPVP